MCLAIPMKVIELVPQDRAVVETGEVSMEISVALVDGVCVGDYVIVHTGFALEIMDPKSAAETLVTLNELADMRDGEP
jgi:hydrogenase expression/formation protein HypC